MQEFSCINQKGEMKSFLVAFNATAYSRFLAAFAITMSRDTHSAFYGVFFNPTAALLSQYPLSGVLPMTSAGLASTEILMEESCLLFIENRFDNRAAALLQTLWYLSV